MGVPPPTNNLALPRYSTGLISQTDTGTVVEIVGDQANVSIAGSVFTVKIPGSVIGVKVGKTVQVRSQGNSRVISAVTTEMDKPTYTGNPSSVNRGATTPPPSTPAGASGSPISPAVTGVTLMGSGEDTVAKLRDAVNDRYTFPINYNFYNLRDSILALNSIVSALITTVNGIASNSGQQNTAILSTQNKLNTLAKDLRDTTGILE